MSIPRIAINGFGRIGRTITRIAKLRRHFDIVAINDTNPPEALLYSFRFDSIHGRYPGSVALVDGTMNIDGDPFLVLSEKDPSKLPWKELKVDYVIESTGAFRKLAQLEQHLTAGAQRVILTVPCKDPLEATLVMGVNDHVVNGNTRIISNASCTTNCAAPLVKVLHDTFGVKRGLLNTIHAYTSDQRLIDAPHKEDLRRSRNAATNIVPTSTGAAIAIGEVIPALKGRRRRPHSRARAGRNRGLDQRRHEEGRRRPDARHPRVHDRPDRLLGHHREHPFVDLRRPADPGPRWAYGEGHRVV